MNIGIICAIWRRHDLEKITIDRLKRQAKQFGIGPVIIAGSEGNKSREVAGDETIYIETENFPISAKHNKLLEEAKKHNLDGVLLFGSDDMVCDNYFKNIVTSPALYNADQDKIIGLSDIYFYDTKTKVLGHWPGYLMGKQSAGAGRFFSKRILDSVDWKLWPDDMNKGLDGACNKKLGALGFTDSTYSMSDLNAFLVDIKHSNSISNREIVNACKPSRLNLMMKKLGNEDFKKVMELHHKEISYEEMPDEVEIKITKTTHSLNAGDVYKVHKSTGKALVDKGKAEYFF